MPTPRALNTRHGLRTGTKSVVDGSGTVVDVGTLASLTTTSKSTIVEAVNEVKGNFVNITTSDVPEPVVSPTRLYFTDARARSSTSVTDLGGDGSLGYDNLTGVLTYTGPSAAEVRAHFSGGTGVTITGGVVAIGQPVSTSSNVTFANTTLTGVLYGPAQFVIDPAAFGDATGEVIILGNLTVQGTTTTINSTTLVVEDKNILLAKSAINSLQADGTGISVAGAEASILYVALTDSWNLNRTVKGVDGTVSSPTYSFATDPGLGLYRSGDDQASIATNGLERLRVGDTAATLVGSLNLVFDRGTYSGTVTTTTLTANRTYTLPNVTGTLVTSGDTGTITSAMIADGTIANIDINASAAIEFSKLASLTSANILVGSSGNVATSVAVTGDITIGNTGVTAITAGVIVDGDINASAGIVDTKLATIATAGKVSNSATTATSANTVNTIVARDASGNFTAGTITAALTGNADTATKLSSTRTFAVTGDITGTVNSDLTTGASIATSIATGVIVDADVNASAAIAFSKLASLTSANILVGSSGNVATSVSVTGDVTIGNTGVTAITAGVIVDGDISPTAEIAVSKLADGAPRQLLQTDAAGTGVEWADNIDVPGTLDVTGNAVFDSRVTINGTDITESARDIEESRLIRRNATVSIGTPGTVPFGVGPIIPPGMSLVGIGPDAYNVIDIYSGSVC